MNQSQKKSITSAVARPFAWLTAGIGWRVRHLHEKVRDAKRSLELFIRSAVGLNHPETTLISDSQHYWNDPSNRHLEQYSHWKGAGIFTDESRWLTLGHEHLGIYEEFARVVDLTRPLKRILEWGCGGGMNAVHFGHEAVEFCGVDIAPASLEECGRQMKLAGLQNFIPVLIDAPDPEAALARVPGPCDLFLSTYVFEALPSPEYGLRVLRIAFKLLAPGGIAIIQIKYNEANWKTASRTWAYAKNLAWNATYRIEEFWGAAEECGFCPRMITLVPRQPLLNDRNYAYFLLQKQITTSK